MSRSDGIMHPLAHTALLISMYFPPEPGGGATTAWNRALILHKLGYTVFVLCGFPSYPKGKLIEPVPKGKFFSVEKNEYFTIIRIRLLSLESKGYFRRFILFTNFIFLSIIWMPRISRVTSKIDVVYALSPILFSSFIGSLYSKLTKSFFIYEASDLWPEELVAFKSNLSFLIFFIGKKLARMSYKLPDMIVVTTNSAAKYVTNYYKPSRHIHVMPIGVEPSKYHIKSKEYARKELIKNRIFPSYIENMFIILYAGIISKITRIENLVHAADKLKDIEKNIIFLVIGDGDDKKRIEEIKQSKRLENLILLPFQDSALVPYIISAADVCVVSLPSEPIYEVTVSTKFFDYLACHKPQIGICRGELADILNSNKIGFTVNDGEVDKLVDAIVSLKNSPSLVHQMEKNSYAALPLYSLETLATNLDIVLRQEIIRKKDTKLKY